MFVSQRHPAFLASLFCFAAFFPLHADDAQSPEANSAGAKISGIDQSLFSDSVKPGDNFYEYANQKWLETTEIPGDKSNYGIFTVLADGADEQVRQLIEEAGAKQSEPGSPAQKVGDLYKSVLNVEARNAAGVKPLGGILRMINRIQNRRECAAAIGSLARSGVYGPFAAYVNVDARDSDNYAVYVTQAGLTLPDREYYLDDDNERFVKLRGDLQTYISDMLRFLDVPNSGQAAREIFEIETAIAEKHWTKTENRDPIKTYNKIPVDELVDSLRGFDWRAYADHSGISGQNSFVIRQPSYMESMAELFAAVDVETMEELSAIPFDQQLRIQPERAD